jgi:hypothetical protein
MSDVAKYVFLPSSGPGLLCDLIDLEYDLQVATW